MGHVTLRQPDADEHHPLTPRGQDEHVAESATEPTNQPKRQPMRRAARLARSSWLSSARCRHCRSRAPNRLVTPRPLSVALADSAARILTAERFEQLPLSSRQLAGGIGPVA